MRLKNSDVKLKVSVVGLAFLSLPIITSSFAHADDDSVVDEVNITVPVSCTLSGTGQNSHNAEINNGTYNSAIGETTLKAFCNDSNGFAIYAIGFTDNEDGKNVLTNSTLGSTYDITTGTAITGNDSKWAMKLSTITSPTPTYPIIIAGSNDDTEKEQGDPDYSTFQSVPDDYTLVAKRTASTDIGTNAEGATLKSTYQAYISKTQPAGTYTGQVKYTLIHPHNATKPIKPVTIATAEYLQEVNSCPADLPEEQVYTLKDSRDEQEYKVAKLKDGKCWMVENLNIAGGTALSSEDTDFEDSYILPTSDGWTVADNKLVLPESPIDSPTGFDTVYESTYIYNSNNRDCGSEGSGIPCYSYYRWNIATLNSGASYSTEDTDAPYSICPKGWRLPTSGEGSYDGWKRGDYYALATAYGIGLEGGPYQSFGGFYYLVGPDTVPNFLPAGGYTDAFGTGGTTGMYWSSTYGKNGIYGLYFHPVHVDVSDDLIGSWGLPVRCLFSISP